MIKQLIWRTEYQPALKGALRKSRFPVQPHWRFVIAAIVGGLSSVLLLTLLLFSTSSRSLAAGMPTEATIINDPHQGDPTVMAHQTLLATAEAEHRMETALAALAASTGTNNPHAGHQSNAAINSSLLARLQAARHATGRPGHAVG